MTPTPLSREEILASLEKSYDYGSPPSPHHLREWLSSALSSYLLWAIEEAEREMRNDVYNERDREDYKRYLQRIANV